MCLHTVHLHVFTGYSQSDMIFISDNGQDLANQGNISVLQLDSQTITFSNRAEQSEYELVLSEIFFVNNEDEPGSRLVTINFTIAEDNLISIATTQVEILPTNDPVFFNFEEKILSYREEEGQAINLFTANDVLSDSDGSSLESVHITIVSDLNFDPFDILFADAGSSGLTVTADSDALGRTLVISGSANFSVYESVLQTVTFVNTFPGILPHQRNITVITFDGMTSSPIHTILINIVLFDDPPICYFDELVSKLSFVCFNVIKLEVHVQWTPLYLIYSCMGFSI